MFEKVQNWLNKNLKENAKILVGKTMGQRQKTEYVNIELTKLSNPLIYDDEENVQCGRRNLEELSLFEIGKVNSELEKKLRNAVFEQSKDTDGNYTCACCGKKGTDRIFFQVDHMFYHMQTYLRGKEECDIGKIGLDEMIIIRII